MNNDQKAARLEELADNTLARIDHKDADLLRECAAMWREQGKGVGSKPEYPSIEIDKGSINIWYKETQILAVSNEIDGSHWFVYHNRGPRLADGHGSSIFDALFNGVAWVDGKDGRCE